MSRPSSANPFSLWMQWDDVYVTFDALDVAKKSADGELQTIGHVENGNLSWPLFMQLISGFMQYSAVETGFSKPLTTPENLQALADWLEKQDDNSFVLQLENCRVQRKGLEGVQTMAEQATKFWSSMIDANPFMPFNPIKSWESHFDILKNPEIDLGQLAGQCAQWLRLMQVTQPAR